MGTFEALVHGTQGGTFTCLTWIRKPTVSYECALCFFPSLAISTTLVALVFTHKLMQLWIAAFFWYAAGDSLLNPPQNHLGIILTDSRSTIYPKYHVIVRCSPGLILFLVKVVTDSAQNLTLENHCLKEIVEFL